MSYHWGSQESPDAFLVPNKSGSSSQALPCPLSSQGYLAGDKGRQASKQVYRHLSVLDPTAQLGDPLTHSRLFLSAYWISFPCSLCSRPPRSSPLLAVQPVSCVPALSLSTVCLPPTEEMWRCRVCPKLCPGSTEVLGHQSPWVECSKDKQATCDPPG